MGAEAAETGFPSVTGGMLVQAGYRRPRNAAIVGGEQSGMSNPGPHSVAGGLERPHLFHLPVGALFPGGWGVRLLPVLQVGGAMDPHTEPVAPNCGKMGPIGSRAKGGDSPTRKERAGDLPSPTVPLDQIAALLRPDRKPGHPHLRTGSVLRS